MAAKRTTPQQRDLGTIIAGKYLVRVKGYPTPLVAKAGGGQSGATLCDADLNYVGTVASASDSLLLPQSEIGREITILNQGAQAAQIFGNTLDTTSGTINGTAGTTGISLAANSATIFYCPAAGVWLTK